MGPRFQVFFGQVETEVVSNSSNKNSPNPGPLFFYPPLYMSIRSSYLFHFRSDLIKKSRNSCIAVDLNPDAAMFSTTLQLSCGAQLREPLRKAPREIIPGLKEHLKGSWSTAATFLLFCSVIKFSKEGTGREGTGRCGVAEMLALAQAVKAFEATVPRQKTRGGGRLCQTAPPFDKNVFEIKPQRG